MKVRILVLAMVVMLLAGCTPKSQGLGENFLEEAHVAVKEAYGDDYIPSMTIDENYLEDIYGLNFDWVEKHIAEGPMMSTHVDTFIGIKAKPGKAQEVEKALNAYREYLVTESLQYPMNLAKVNASTVYVVEDHVFFLMLGKINDSGEATEEEALKFAKEQVDVAVSAIEGIVK